MARSLSRVNNLGSSISAAEIEAGALTAADAAADLATQAELDAVAAAADITATWTVTANTQGNVYQNTGATGLLVNVDVTDSGSGTDETVFECENANPPAQDHARSKGIAAAGAFAFTGMLVPPGWYYRVRRLVGTATVSNWLEAQL